MRDADDLGREMRRALGEPGPGATDATFLAGLAAGRRRLRGRRVLTAAALLLAAGGAVLLAAVPRGRTAAPPPEPAPPAAHADPAPVEDPDAALLLAAARLRLTGFGDPAVAPVKLRELLRRYPGSRAAAEAATLLKTLEGRKG